MGTEEEEEDEETLRGKKEEEKEESRCLIYLMSFNFDLNLFKVFIWPKSRHFVK